MKISNNLLVLVSTILLAGCSSFGIDGPFSNSQKLTAEQRMLLVTEKAPVIDKKGKVIKERKRVVCAEPSPDAISSLAIKAILEGELPGGKSVKGSVESAQTVSELGERTSVIQLLRDSLYRACEAHMNGLLDTDEYTDILAFFDLYSLTLLGIENITYSHRALAKASAAIPASGNGNKSTDTDAALAATMLSTSAPSAIIEILSNYYQAKGTLFCMLEMKKAYNANPTRFIYADKTGFQAYSSSLKGCQRKPATSTK